MTVISKKSGALFALAVLAMPMSTSVYAQPQDAATDDITVTGTPPADLTGMTDGPEVEGMISARKGDRIQVTSADGANTVIALSEGTEIKSSKGLFGMGRSKLAADSLLNGLPVSIKTVQWGDGLVAKRIDLKDKDLKTATMIRTGTAQGFAEQTAATEALRGRVANIDQYNIKSTTDVHFDTGKALLSAQDKSTLCATATQADGIANSLILVVGYTDSTGSDEVNQALSERRAGAVINYLQQKCGWKPYRMMTPTGMATADPAADNSTPEGRAQNRRVSVNILVSKGLDGM